MVSELLFLMTEIKELYHLPYTPIFMALKMIVKTQPFFQFQIHSFIHTEHLYSASSRELLRGAPYSSTAKKSSLKLRKKRR